MTSDELKLSSEPEHGLREKFPVGTIVWGKLPGYHWWPGTVISYDGATGSGASGEEGGGASPGEKPTLSSEPQAWIKWFGENNLSQVW